MTEAKPLNRHRSEWQEVPAGESTLAVDEPRDGGGTPLSLFVGASEGIDVTSIVQVDGLQPGEVAEIYFARVYYDEKAGADVFDSRHRDPGQVDIAARADGKPASNSVRFAGSLAKHTPAFRLRVMISTPRPVRARMNSRGWVIQ